MFVVECRSIPYHDEISNYTVFAEFPIDRISKWFRNCSIIKFIIPEITINGKKITEVYTNYYNYRMNIIIYKKNCIKCGIFGNIYRLESNRSINIPHLNLYHKHRNGKLTMLTADHIIPRSEGGPNKDFNIQLMCSKCNSKKGSRIEVKWFTPKLIKEIETFKPELLSGLRINENNWNWRKILI